MLLVYQNIASMLIQNSKMFRDNVFVFCLKVWSHSTTSTFCDHSVITNLAFLFTITERLSSGLMKKKKNLTTHALCWLTFWYCLRSLWNSIVNRGDTKKHTRYYFNIQHLRSQEWTRQTDGQAVTSSEASKCTC